MARLIDSNCLMDNYPDIFESFNEDLIIHSIVLEELDNIIHSSNSEERKFKARQARNAIKRASNKVFNTSYSSVILPSGWDINKNDNKLIAVCKDNGYILVTNDLAMQIKAESIGVKWEAFGKSRKSDLYLGYKEVVLNDYELAMHYECPINKWELKLNEYLLIRNNEGQLIDKAKWTEKGFKGVVRKNMKSLMFGDLKPKDEYQELCYDSLQTDQFTIITGKAGSGKSLLSLMYCMWAIQTGKYNRVVIMYNPTKVRGAVDMGYYSGNSIEKGLQQFIGNMLNTKFGDKSIVGNLLAQDQLQIVSMADCRGMEITDNQILYIPEAQNTNPDLMKICLSRVSKDAKCIIEGDHLNQVDLKSFEGKGNGLSRAIDVFTDRDFVSYVHLQNVFRSKIAEIADLL